MSAQSAISAIFLAFSVLLVAAAYIFISKIDPLIRKYIRMSTFLYVSGTLLVFVITFIKPDVPLIWVWLCEGFVFAIYAVSSVMVVFIVKKFTEGANTSANQNNEEKNKNPDPLIQNSDNACQSPGSDKNLSDSGIENPANK